MPIQVHPFMSLQSPSFPQMNLSLAYHPFHQRKNNKHVLLVQFSQPKILCRYLRKMTIVFTELLNYTSIAVSNQCIHARNIYINHLFHDLQQFTNKINHHPSYFFNHSLFFTTKFCYLDSKNKDIKILLPQII